MQSVLIRIGVGLLVYLPPVAFAAQSQQCLGLEAVSPGACNNGTTALPVKIGTIISTLFIVAGAIAVLIMVIGGVRYIASTGDAKRVQAAKDTIFYAVIGLIVVILARAIVGYVIGTIAP